MEYPRFVFISPGKNTCQGGSFDCELVKDEKEHKAALDAGFSDSVPDALEAVEAVSDKFQSQHHELPGVTTGTEITVIPGVTGLPKRGRPAKYKE